MLSQRAGDGVNPAEIQFRKWTAKGTMKGIDIFHVRVLMSECLICNDSGRADSIKTLMVCHLK